MQPWRDPDDPLKENLAEGWDVYYQRRDTSNDPDREPAGADAATPRNWLLWAPLLLTVVAGVLGVFPGLLFPFVDTAVAAVTGVAKAGELVRFVSDGTEIRLAATKSPVEFLVLVGRPLRRGVVRYGPFVAEDEAGIRTAMMAFQRGRFGTLG